MKYGSQMKKNMQEETDRQGASALPEGFDSVCEEVAAAVHDAWTKEKIADGWKAADHRDAVQKLDDRLIPYNELPEEEKKYDRATAEAAIRALLSCGYEITKKN